MVRQPRRTARLGREAAGQGKKLGHLPRRTTGQARRKFRQPRRFAPKVRREARQLRRMAGQGRWTDVLPRRTALAIAALVRIQDSDLESFLVSESPVFKRTVRRSHASYKRGGGSRGSSSKSAWRRLAAPRSEERRVG